MSLPNIVLTGPPEMAEDHQILGAGGPLGQCSKKLISNPVKTGHIEENGYQQVSAIWIDSP